MRYWIAIAENTREAQRHLRSLGIVLGGFDRKASLFSPCIIPQEAFEKLNREWGKRYIWGPVDGSAR